MNINEEDAKKNAPRKMNFTSSWFNWNNLLMH